MGYNPDVLDERGAEVLLLEEYKQKADQWKQFANKRSEKYDFRQINKDLENAQYTSVPPFLDKREPSGENGQLDFLNATANRKRAYDDLVLDYLDFLYNTGQENKFRNTQAAFNELSNQYKEGGLNATQEGDLERIYKEAMSARNIAAEVDYFDVIGSTDINEYEKQLVALETEITQKANNNNLTQADIDAYQIKMEQIRQQTGFTKEKEAQYINAIQSFVDPREKPIYTGALDEKQKKNTKQKGEAYVDVQDGSVADATEGMVKGYVGTVGRMMVGILQAPKAINDAFGNESYTWVDELDAYSRDVIENREGRFGRPEQLDLTGSIRDSYEELPAIYRYSRLFGEATGSLAVFAGGGQLGYATKILGASDKFARGTALTATYLTAHLATVGDNYHAALALGKSPKQAAIEANILSSIEASLELIIPDYKLLHSENLRRSVLKSLKNGATMKQAIKDAMSAIPDAAKYYGKVMGKEGLLEEGGQAVGSDITKGVFNTIDDDHPNYKYNTIQQ